MAIDPVCGVAVDENDPPAQTEYHGQTYYFHNLDCKMIFDANPKEYADQVQSKRR
ncbi:MAG: YHS domain-containing protein [Chloroflexota bacterium]